jgi:hypothetical protein
MTPYVGENFCPQSKLADSLAIESRLLGCRWGSELNILNAKRIKRFGDCNFSLGVKKGVCELFSL